MFIQPLLAQACIPWTLSTWCRVKSMLGMHKGQHLWSTVILMGRIDYWDQRTSRGSKDQGMGALPLKRPWFFPNSRCRVANMALSSTDKLGSSRICSNHSLSSSFTEHHFLKFLIQCLWLIAGWIVHPLARRLLPTQYTYLRLYWFSKQCQSL